MRIETKKEYITDNCKYLVDDKDKIRVLNMIVNSEIDKPLITDNGNDCICMLDNLDEDLVNDIYFFIKEVVERLSQLPL